MILIITIVILVLIAGYCNGRMDYIKRYNLDEDTWMDKWLWEGVSRKPFTSWYYFGIFKPEYKEKFPYSSTVLVFTTDDWHFYKWVMFGCYEAFGSLVLIECFQLCPLWVFPMILGLKALRGITFNWQYEKKL